MRNFVYQTLCCLSNNIQQTKPHTKLMDTYHLNRFLFSGQIKTVPTPHHLINYCTTMTTILLTTTETDGFQSYYFYNILFSKVELLTVNERDTVKD